MDRLIWFLPEAEHLDAGRQIGDREGQQYAHWQEEYSREK